MPKQFDISKYQYNPKQTQPQRAAHFLDWCAKHYPMQFVPYNVLVKAVNGYTKTPILASQEVEMMRSRLARVRDVLQKGYGRELYTMPGTGARATVDSADTLKYVVPKRITRVKAASESLAKTAALVDTAKVPNEGEFKTLKAWFNRDVHDVMKGLSALESKLALPATTQSTAAKPNGGKP